MQKKIKKSFVLILSLLMIMTVIPFARVALATDGAKVITADSDGMVYVDGEALEITGYYNNDLILPAGNYKLTGDVTSAYYINAKEGEVTLDLNGYVWDMRDCYLLLSNQFSLYDTSDAGTGKLTSSWGMTVYIGKTDTQCGTFNLYSGTVENTSTLTNSYIISASYGDANLYGGKIKGNAYAFFNYMFSDLTINLDGTVIENGEGYAQVKSDLMDGDTPKTVIDVTDYTGESFTVDAEIDEEGKIKIFEGIKSAQEAENYQINFLTKYGEVYYEKTEYDEATGEKYIYVARNAFTQQPSDKNNYTVEFNNPDASFQWYEVNENEIGKYTTEEGDHLFPYNFKKGDILKVTTASEIEYAVIEAGSYRLRLDKENKTATVRIDEDETIEIFTRFVDPENDVELNFSVIKEISLEGETGKTLQTPEHGKSYWCKATVGAKVYTSDIVVVCLVHSYDENGKCYYCKMQADAKVTDKDGNAVGTYKTLAEAVTAASASEGSILTLLDDITLTETARISSGKFTLDLNGKTILNKTDDVLMVYYDANITIKDSCEGGTVETGGDYCYGISNLAELTVESGTIKGNGSGISNHGTLTVNGGNFEAYTYGAITNKGTAKIYGGVFEGIDRGEGVQNDGNGEIYIYGGEIIGNTALLNTGTAYISGGEFNGNDYAALNILKGTVEVTGGSFTGTDFSNGYFSGTPYGEWTVDFDSEATFILKGGEFPNGFVTDETTENAFLAEGYYFRDADGKIVEVAEDSTVINGHVKVSKGADLSEAVITLDNTEFTYNGGEIRPTVLVTVSGKALTEGKDYAVSYANNVNAGKATVTFTAVADGNYTGKATADFTITKKPVTVTAIAPDKVYDGTGAVDISNVILIFEGIVEGDDVKAVIKSGMFTNSNVGEKKRVIIAYTASGEDLNNYKFPEDDMIGIPEADPNLHYAFAVASITAKDISDGFIILGDPLTYNGTEQTQTVEKVLATGTAPEVTYTVSGNKATNVGVYLLTVTGTGNFTGEAKIAYEIALDDECISHLDRVEDNGVMKWNVKSTDRESLEYVVDQLNNAVTDIADADKKSEWADIKEACEDMLRVINSIELFIADVEEDYSKFSEDTVKSSDVPALDKLVSKVNEIKDRYGFNLTEEEVKKLEDILDGIEKLKAKIDETAKEIERIENAVAGYDKETVTSDDVPELGKLIEDIKALTDGDNLTEDEKAALEEADKATDELVEKLTEVAEEIKRVDEAVKSYDKDSVKSSDSEDIAQLKEDIQALIDSTNTTENEKTVLEDMIADVEGLEDKIAETEQQLEEIKDIENNYNPEKISSDDKAAIEDKIAEIEAVNPDNLTDEQKAEYEEIKAGFEALLEKIAAADKAVADIGAELEMLDEERVTIFWEDDIEALKAKIDELIADKNTGEAEKAKLDDYKAQAEKLIEIINTPKEYFSLRLFYFIWDCITWKYNGVLSIFSKFFS